MWDDDLMPASNYKNALPTRYDPRPGQADAASAVYTSVKDQGTLGTCWAFAANAAVEAYVKKTRSGNPDFSEQHTRYAMSTDGSNRYGADRRNYDGGNERWAAAYFTRAFVGGAVNESDMAYSNSTSSLATSSYYNKTRQGLVTDMRFIPNLANSVTPGSQSGGAYKTAVKTAVQNYGSVDISYYDLDAYKNTLSGGMIAYHRPTADGAMNHSVQLIGWDDNYAASNFRNRPAGNGAWLIKNSWGTGWSAGGYFWLSYYTWIGDVTYVAGYTPSFSGAILDYSPLGSSGWQGITNISSIYAGNIFAAAEASSLDKVMFYNTNVNTSYNVYALATSSSGTAALNAAINAGSKANGTFTDEGYYTIDITNISVSSGQNLVIVVKTTASSSRTLYVPTEDKTSYSVARSGQSYYTSNTSSWTDSGSSLGKNLNIRAIMTSGTSRTDGDVLPGSAAPSYTTLALNTNYTVSITSAEQFAYYRYTPSTTGSYTLTSTGSVDPVAYLYDSQMSQIATNDDASGRNFALTATLTAGQTYYYGVRIYSSGTGSFTIRLTSGGGGGSTYTTLALNTNYTVSISTARQVVYYQYTPSATGYYTLTSSGSIDSYCTLYNSSMAELASNDDGGSGTNFSLRYSLTAGTTYIYGVRCYGSNTGTYTICLTTEGGASYTTLALNTNYTVNISAAGQVAYYRFTPTSTGYYTLASTGSADSYCTLYNSSMSSLASNDDGGTDCNFSLRANLTAGTTYIYGVRLYSSSYTGSFTIRLTSDSSGYPVLALNTDYTANIASGGDLAYATFTPTSSGYYILYSNAPNLDPIAYLYNSNRSSQLAYNDDAFGGLNFALGYNMTAGITYVFGVGLYGGATGSYSIRLVPSACSGPCGEAGADALLKATDIGQANTSATATINHGAHWRVFKFTPNASGYYTFYASGSLDTYGGIVDTDMDVLIEVDDANGGRNFSCRAYLNGGQTYYLVACFYSDSQTGSYPVYIESSGGGGSTGYFWSMGVETIFSSIGLIGFINFILYYVLFGWLWMQFFPR
ncbi:MAG: lectin like domain-containing protein [Oscillospiraceae bacterium]|jgi:C1A family cysteine protease|nr:lectin like domain-containing protein [Oscillospiraceae bacterium]